MAGDTLGLMPRYDKGGEFDMCVRYDKTILRCAQNDKGCPVKPGMTKNRPGMTENRPGMTENRPGMTEKIHWG